MTPDASIPLCVDLDGTLVKIDVLHQSFFPLLRRNATQLFRLPAWLRAGKARLKAEVAARILPDPATLPYNRPLLRFLKDEREKGRRIVLTTAADRRVAAAVADHLGIFSEILSSSEAENLRGEAKLSAIHRRHSTFDYVGNDRSDAPLWDAAEKIYLANPSSFAKKRYENRAERVFEDRRGGAVARAMRFRQWLKNLLIFAPAFLAHRFSDPSVWLRALLAFLAFGLAASSIYVLNDLFDVEADRHHPRKRARPLAAGDLSVPVGLALSALSALGAGVISSFLPIAFSGALSAYFLLTVLYSLRLKQLAVVDVLTLAVLYAMRIVAGGMATETPISSWLVIFSLFLFLSLALVKRLAELKEGEASNFEGIDRRERGYAPGDLPLLMAFGTAAGYLSVFVFTTYLAGDQVARLYTRPEWLRLFCPLLLYWITRIWLLSWRGRLHDDPLAFAAQDAQTYVAGALGIVIVLLAI